MGVRKQVQFFFHDGNAQGRIPDNLLGDLIGAAQRALGIAHVAVVVEVAEVDVEIAVGGLRGMRGRCQGRHGELAQQAPARECHRTECIMWVDGESATSGAALRESSFGDE